MSALGRISGPLLKSNLIRNGIDLAFETDLLYLDVNNQRIGVKNAAPQYELDITGTTRTTNLIVTNRADIGNINIVGNTISSDSNTLNLGTADDVVYNNRLTIDSISIDGNTISTNESNANLELRPNGTGSVEVLSNMNVDGNIHATGNISANGNIVIGDENTDDVSFNAEIASNLIPDETNQYTLGSADKEWADAYVNNLVSTTVTSTDLEVDGIDLVLRQGNIVYVAENGSDTQSGTHPQDPVGSIKYALDNLVESGDTVYIYPGVYTEEFPLTVPQGVSVRGLSIRSVNIQPTTETRYNDAFLLNGESTVEDVTVKDFYSGGNYFQLSASTGSLLIFEPIGTAPQAHTYVSGGTVTDVNGLTRNVTSATYNNTNGQFSIVLDAGGLDTYDSGIGEYRKVFVEGLVFSCNGGTRTFPDNGYAFRFATDFEVTSRSPYIKNISVITKGSTTTVEDPRGFNAGDAGKGVYVDGAYATTNSKEAAMLFHSVTFITPGVDALTATNGARIEWLNSFSYFANRSMYAYDSNEGLYGDGKTRIRLSGLAGNAPSNGQTVTFTSTDDSTVVGPITIESVENNDILVIDGKNTELVGFDTTPASITFSGGGSATSIANLDLRDFGAEIRMIGSASVYGNYGLVGDGEGVLMYAIGHNLAYIGNGKEVTNDPGTVIQENEVIETNGAQIRYNSVDHKGDFRVGDLFYVNQETGSVTFAVNDFAINTENGITITTGANTTFIDGTKLETGDWRISGNTIETLSLDANFQAAGGTINLQNNTNITGNLDVSGNVTIGGNITIGDEATDTIQIVAGIDSDIIPRYDSIHSLGTDTKRWSNLYTNEINLDSIEISDNYITTTESNADLDLRANGTGEVLVPNNDVQIDNNLNVDGTTNLRDTNVVGTINQTGDTTVTGNYTITGEFSNGDIQVLDNTIQTTASNSDLELRANGSGQVLIPNNNVVISENLTVRGTSYLTDVNITGTVTQTGNYVQNGNFNIAGSFSNGNIEIEDNFITSTESNSDLELRANGTGEILVPTNNVQIDNNLTVSGSTDLQDTTVTGTITHVGNLNQTGDTTVTGNVTVTQDLDVSGAVQLEEILIDDNYITTTTSNANLELRANGTGEILVPNNNVRITNNLDVSGDINSNNLTATANITSTDANIGDIQISNTTIEATASNADLELRANGTGEILIPTNDVILSQNLTVNGNTELGITTVTGTITHTGNTTQNGNYTISGIFDNGNIQIAANTIQTSDSNSNLELRANGSGIISIPENNVEITNDLDVDGITNLDDTNIDGTLTHLGDTTQTGNYTITGQFTNGNIQIDGNTIETTSSNANLDLRANGSGIITVPSNDVTFSQTLTVNGTTNLQDTSVTGTVTHIGDVIQTGNLDIAGEITNGNILIEDNFITTTVTNSDLELRASGTGQVIIPNNDVQINNNLTVNGDTVLGFTELSGDVTITGDITQEGSYTITNSVTVEQDLTVGRSAQLEEILIDDNYITTTSSNANLELRANGTGEILVPNNDVHIINNLNVDNSITAADITATGSITANSLTNGNILIDDNFITTTNSNSDLEIRTSGTGNITLPNNDIIAEENLTVNGTTTLQNTIVNGTITHVGDTTQTGNFDLTGNFDINGNVTVSSTAQFENVKISGNVIETTETNSDLELRANGTGEILVPNNDVNITGTLTVDGTLAVGNINATGTITANNFTTGDILIDDNYITTTISNSDLELRGNGTGSIIIDNFTITDSEIASSTDITITPGSGTVIIDSTGSLQLPVGDTSERPTAQTGQIRYNDQLNRFEGYNGSNWINLVGVEDLDGNTKVTAELTEGANDNTIRFDIDGTTVVDINNERLNAHALVVDDIQVDGNVISTTTANTDLVLTANGTGSVTFENFAFNNNTITNTVSNSVTTFEATDDGYVKFDGTYGLVIPSGGNTQRPPLAYTEEGMMRFNTDASRVEIYDGFNWVSVAGSSSGISRADAEDIAFEIVLSLG